MAIIKYNAVHVTPKAHLRYILNPDKNEELKYVTGICCNSDLDAVYEDFKELYEIYDSEKFNLRKAKDGKNHIRIHSYIQSFAAGEVTAEQAHQIGIDWCKAMFGEDRPVIISTHINTDHVHNHIAVCPYDIHGNRWQANKKTLRLAKRLSDQLCLENGLSVIEDPRRKGTVSYAEWLACKNNTSWKVRMADDIDRFIHSPDVVDIPSLIARMKENGYVFTNEKRLIARPANAKRACSLYKLGYGYRYRTLEMRILSKNTEMLGKDFSSLKGEPLYISEYLYNYQKSVYRDKGSPEFNEREFRQDLELLHFLCHNKINYWSELYKYVDKCRSDEKTAQYNYNKGTMIPKNAHDNISELEYDYEQARKKRQYADKMFLRFRDLMDEMHEKIPPVQYPENTDIAIKLLTDHTRSIWGDRRLHMDEAVDVAKDWSEKMLVRTRELREHIYQEQMQDYSQKYDYGAR